MIGFRCFLIKENDVFKNRSENCSGYIGLIRLYSIYLALEAQCLSGLRECIFISFFSFLADDHPDFAFSRICSVEGADSNSLRMISVYDMH